jgi:hypothetical protein
MNTLGWVGQREKEAEDDNDDDGRYSWVEKMS